MSALQAIAFDQYALERLAVTLDGAIRIRSRSEFYLWAQGALQSFLPHETLVCLWGEVPEAQGVELFSRGILAPHAEAHLRTEAGRLRAVLLSHWLRHGRRPCAGPDLEGLPVLAQLIAETGSGNVLFHGADFASRLPVCFFIFMGMPSAVTPREHYLTDLLLPHLYLAFVGLHDRGEVDIPGTHLSPRQSQVLAGIRSGKTNSAIAQELGLSPLTVKNHVQQALRKLAVANRAEAAAVTSMQPCPGTARQVDR